MASPRVIINDRCLRNPRTGVGHYVAQLIARVPAMAPDIDLLPFYTRYFAGRKPQNGPQPVQIDEPTSSRQAVSFQPASAQLADASSEAARFAIEETAAAPVATKTFSYRPWPDCVRRTLQSTYDAIFEAVGCAKGYRLYHEPNHIAAPWHGPIVTTVHDLSVLRHPEWHPVDRVKWYEREFEASLPRSSHFIAVSEFTRQEMIELLDIPPQRITTITNGVGALFHPRPADEVRNWLLERSLPEQYLLFVGTIEPRKNLTGLISAYMRLPTSLREAYPLLLAGMVGWSRESVYDLLKRSGVGDNARVLGYVADDMLAMLYCGARVLVWPSFYEGFGLPPLEAMACGTPVITSNNSSMPEVVGDAGILVNPYNIGRLSEAIGRMLEDDDLVASVSQRGIIRSRLFSWERSAAEHIKIYRQFGSE